MYASPAPSPFYKTVNCSPVSIENTVEKNVEKQEREMPSGLSSLTCCWQPLGNLQEVSRLFVRVLIETLGHQFFPLIQNQF